VRFGQKAVVRPKNLLLQIQLFCGPRRSAVIIFTRAYTNMVNVSEIRTRVYWKMVSVCDGYHIILLGSRSVLLLFLFNKLHLLGPVSW